MGSVAGYVTQIRIGFTRKVGACRLGELVFGQAAGGLTVTIRIRRWVGQKPQGTKCLGEFA